jgi:hypothetical protein
LGGRVLATEVRDYGTIGPHDFAGRAQVGLIRRAAIIGGSACIIEPALPGVRDGPCPEEYSDALRA